MSFNDHVKKPLLKPDKGNTSGGGRIEDLNQEVFLSIKGSASTRASKKKGNN
jgi:hypothetical protein